MFTYIDPGRAVNALPLTSVALELHVPVSRAVEVTRSLGLFALRLGVRQEIHVSPIAVPRIREVLGARRAGGGCAHEA